jgi:hypothetical protein
MREPHSLFGIEQVIEMGVPLIHPRGCNGLDLFRWQFSGRKASSMFLEATELLIFIRPYEISGDLAMTGHGDRLTLREHSVATEIAGKFRCRDWF